MKYLIYFIALIFVTISSKADSGRIYTKQDINNAGGIQGQVDLELTHALAVDHERAHVYLARLEEGGKAFHFEHLPVGKYDLVLVSKGGIVCEGLVLGEAAGSLSPTSMKNLQARIAVADSFFNRSAVHRTGIEGDRVLAFVERIRDKLTLKQSGEKLESDLRRLEIIELDRATDDWQMVTSRHIYRENEALQSGLPFFKHVFVSGLGNIRVVDSVKDLGPILLPKN